jgi:uncharacterized protein (TIGR03083 family)
MSEHAYKAMLACWEDLRGVVDTLTEEEWQRPSACEGWRVQDLLAHLSSNLKEVADPTPPPENAPSDAPPMRAEDAMEALVTPRREWTSAQVDEELVRYAEPFSEIIAAMQEEPLASQPLPIADLGTYQMHQFADAFAFDLYCHLRHDLLAPRGPIERSLPAPDELRVQAAVTWMLAGLPQMCGEELAFVDRPVGLRLSGPGGGEWTIAPGDDGLVVEEGIDQVAATVTSTADDFVLWGTRRASGRELTRIEGDEEFAGRFLDEINII